MNEADKEKIIVPIRIFQPYLILLFHRKGLVGRIITRENDIDFFRIHMKGMDNILTTVIGNRRQTGGISGKFRKKTIIISAYNGRHKLGMMQEIEVVNDIDHRNIQLGRNPPVRRKKQVWLYLSYFQRNAVFKKEIPKIGVPRLRMSDNRGYIIAEKK